jgi:CRISPR/Cas system-associated protein Cas10 (large subunit of type III CRISPR-Cas system)
MNAMGSEVDQARSIAERIARRVSHDSAKLNNDSGLKSDLTSELAGMRESLTDLQRRLDQIETKVRLEQTERESSPFPSHSAALRTQSPWLGGLNSSINHPSQEKFGVEEATVAELVDFFQQEKQCTVEPGGKPCDHCAMCSSRGF